MKTPSTNNFRSLRPYLVGIVIGTALAAVSFLGYLAINESDDSTTDPKESSNSQLSIAAKTGTIGPSDDAQDQSTRLSSDLTQLFEFDSDFVRSASLYELLLNASEEELIQLLEDSENISLMNERTSTQVDIFRRLTSLDPQRAFSQLDKYPTKKQIDLVPGILRELSLTDLDAAIASAKSLDRPVRIVALQTILEYRFDLTETELKGIARQVENESYALRWISERSLNELVDNPEEAWIVLTEDDRPDALQLDSFIATAKNWIDHDGMEVLSRMDELSSNESQDFYFKSNLLAAIAQERPQQVFEFLAHSSSEEHSFLLHPVLKEWVKSDPETAFAALYSLPQSADSPYLESAVVMAWVRHDPSELIEWIDVLSKEGQLTAIEEAVAVTARSSPEQALKLMDSMSSKLGSTSTVSIRLAQVWAQSDPRQAMEWALSSSQAQNPGRVQLIEAVLRKLVHVDSQHAMRVALDQPLKSAAGGMENTIIVELSRTDVEAAIRMLEQVREESKQFTHAWVASELVKAGDPLRGLELVEELPEENRSMGYYQVAYHWAVQDSKHMLESLSTLESDETKSYLARELVIYQRSKPTLTDDEVEYAKTYLNEEDAAEIRRREAQ